MTQPMETVDFLLSKAARLDKARPWEPLKTGLRILIVVKLL